jgi:hypothetical protein
VVSSSFVWPAESQAQFPNLSLTIPSPMVKLSATSSTQIPTALQLMEVLTFIY